MPRRKLRLQHEQKFCKFNLLLLPNFVAITLLFLLLLLLIMRAIALEANSWRLLQLFACSVAHRAFRVVCNSNSELKLLQWLAEAITWNSSDSISNGGDNFLAIAAASKWVHCQYAELKQCDIKIYYIQAWKILHSNNVSHLDSQHTLIHIHTYSEEFASCVKVNEMKWHSQAGMRAHIAGQRNFRFGYCQISI